MVHPNKQVNAMEPRILERLHQTQEAQGRHEQKIEAKVLIRERSHLKWLMKSQACTPQESTKTNPVIQASAGEAMHPV